MVMFQVGFSHPVGFEAPEGVTLTVEGNNRVVVSGRGQGAGRRDGCPDPPDSAPRAVQGQGDQVRRRDDSTEGRQGRRQGQEVGAAVFKRPDARGLRQKRHRRIRRFLSGTGQRPRLAVFRSLEHIYGQIIDDTAGHTLVGGLGPRGRAARTASGAPRATARSRWASFSPSAPRRRASRRSCSIAVASCTTGGSRRSQMAPARAAWSSEARRADRAHRDEPEMQERTCQGLTPQV